MTLTEYNNQEYPVRMPRVLLDVGEYILGLKITIMGGMETHQQVFIKGYPGEYCIVNKWPGLYTTDNDGNPKSKSCFTIHGI